MRTARRRAAVIGAAGAALALTLAGCSGGGDSEPTASETSASTEESASTDGAYPVTIDGALGSVTIEEKPERVVALGWGTDIAYSLGTVPVGVEAQPWGGDADGYTPWFREALEAGGDELPATIANTGEYDVDAIIALEPDLILAPNSGLTQEQYDQLSDFTNVVAYPEGPWLTPVDEQIEITAQALGVPEQAQELIDATDAVVADAAAANPDLANYTFTYVYLGAEAGTLDIYPQGDGRVDLLTGLGLQPDPVWADYAPTETSFVMSLGLENADQLASSDIIVTWFNDETEQATATSQPLWQSIPAVQNDAVYEVLDRGLGLATTVSTPLSVPWAIEAYVPILNETVAKAG
ncbi:iron-siderophore ABC transporter substrate-binding protein [Serinibacter arcticus]|uniref:Iron-siderophore ABC transporter substrate-binding protein n=1 Tax=Serinibacter arcticus TaxID=1655435 RepID=A0A2U2A043_9MICO|nr:iron-siderophore ABC transporter substrate-binding protein [Serinibacter arcticus]